MAAEILQLALISAPITCLALALLGYRKKLQLGITFCAGVVSAMLACAILVLLNMQLSLYVHDAFIIPLALLLDFVLIGLGVGFSWKLLLKTLIAHAIAAVIVCFILLII